MTQETTKRYSIWPGILRRGLLIFVLCLIVWLIGRSCSGDTRHPRESGPASLRIATDYTPDNFSVQDSGAFGGRQAELAALLFPDTAITWSLAESRAQVLEDLASGAIDLYAASVPLSSADSLDRVLTSVPLYTSSYALFCSEEAEWLADFTGSERIPLYLSTEDEAARIIAENIRDLSYPMIEPIMLPDPPMKLALRVVRGDLKYVLIDRSLAHSIHAKSSTTRVVEDIAFETDQVWLVSEARGHQLLDTLNHRISRLRDTPEWHHVLDQTDRH